MVRVIPYVVASEYPNGIYQGTFRWDVIDEALNFLGNYWDIQFQRTNNYNAARYKIVQAKTNPNSNWAAWTNGNVTKVSPVFNFNKGRFVTARVIMHEFMHAAGGGSHSSNPAALMSTNGGDATFGNITASDYPWMPYPWKSSLRPTQEPQRLKNQFGAPTGMFGADDPKLEFGCGCSKSLMDKLFGQKP
jgi:hypothetical protein